MLGKLGERIANLEREIKEKFENTGLVSNVKIKGSLNDNKNPLHLEYKIKNNVGENEVRVRFFRDRISKILLTNHSQIKKIF